MKKPSITFDKFLEKDPKLKKNFNKEFKKWKNRPKSNPTLKIDLKSIKENFNLDLFLNKIVERGNYKFRFFHFIFGLCRPYSLC